jgi:hypothetical protein
VNSQTIGGEHSFQELENTAEDVLRKGKCIQEFVNNRKWKDGEQNRGKPDFNYK